jgi:hypothetical protein
MELCVVSVPAQVTMTLPKAIDEGTFQLTHLFAFVSHRAFTDRHQHWVLGYVLVWANDDPSHVSSEISVLTLGPSRSAIDLRKN